MSPMATPPSPLACTTSQLSARTPGPYSPTWSRLGMAPGRATFISSGSRKPTSDLSGRISAPDDSRSVTMAPRSSAQCWAGADTDRLFTAAAPSHRVAPGAPQPPGEASYTYSRMPLQTPISVNAFVNRHYCTHLASGVKKVGLGPGPYATLCAKWARACPDINWEGEAGPREPGPDIPDTGSAILQTSLPR